MAAQQIDKSDWQGFFDNLSKALPGKQAEIEVASLALGDQILGEWAALHGIAYDPKDALIELALEGTDHLIPDPAEVWIDYDVGGLVSIEIVRRDDSREIVKLRDPLGLPSPQPGQAKA